MFTRTRAARFWSLFSLLALLAGCGSGVPAPTPTPATRASPAPAVLTALPSTMPRPTAIPVPRTVTPRPTPWPTAAREAVPPETLRLTILYDNYVYQAGLEAAWGFAALVEYRGQTLLFDTGGDPAILLHNLDLLGIQPGTIQVLVLSHLHGDHVDGLPALEERRVYPPTYILPSFDSRFRSRFGGHYELRDVAPGQELSPGIYTTGEMVHPAVGIKEQALVISTTSGLIIVTGCAHPGIVEIVAKAKEMFDAPVYLVLGGFHLGELNQAEVEAIIAAFRDLGVQHVAPTHCTGDLAISLFAAAYGDDYVRAGVGQVLLVK